ncbi:MAG: response regulator [Firmicutes bacterium]|nr:response regulator [Bacillota bacterium]
MKYLIVDDEKIALSLTARVIKKCVSEGSEIITERSALKALEICRENDIYVVFPDIDMPEMNGIEFSRKLSEVSPNTNIVFVTGYMKFCYDAWSTNASAFLLKPLNADDVKTAMTKLRKPRCEKPYIQCFGGFKITLGSEMLAFKRKKSMEFFAYLIHRMGAETTEEALRYILWTESEDTEEKRLYIRNIAYDIRKTFKQAGIENIIINNKGSYRIDTQKIECDYYNWVNNISPKPIGEYMEDYAWAEPVRATFDNDYH